MTFLDIQEEVGKQAEKEMREKGLKYVSTPIRLLEYMSGNESISKYTDEIPIVLKSLA